MNITYLDKIKEKMLVEGDNTVSPNVKKRIKRTKGKIGH